jgi:hypothetical protein
MKKALLEVGEKSSWGMFIYRGYISSTVCAQAVLDGNLSWT